MPQAIILDGTGGIEVLKTVTYEISDPKANEVQIIQTAIGVNSKDIEHRNGLYPLSYNPKIPGVCAVGEIAKIGTNVKGFNVGDRVGYATASGGAYSKSRNIDNQLVFALPPELDDKIIASYVHDALTAHYLACRVFIVRPATAVLIHDAASNVGKLLSQWCNKLGAYIIGTVDRDEEKPIATENGCHLVLNYIIEDWVSGVHQATKNIGVNAVYDSVGKVTLIKSLDCLMNMGIMVSYGYSSGQVPTIDINTLAEKSLFFTTPSIYHYKKHRMELLLSCNEVFTNLISGELKIAPAQEFALPDVGKAHQLYESRASTSPIILIP